MFINVPYVQTFSRNCHIINHISSAHINRSQFIIPFECPKCSNSLKKPNTQVKEEWHHEANSQPGCIKEEKGVNDQSGDKNEALEIITQGETSFVDVNTITQISVLVKEEINPQDPLST